MYDGVGKEGGTQSWVALFDQYLKLEPPTNSRMMEVGGISLSLTGRKKQKALLDDPKSDIQKTYDLTKEEDIDNYLSWYRLMKRVVRTATVKSIEKFRYPEPDALDLFKQKVDAHNAEFRLIEDNTEEEQIILPHMAHTIRQAQLREWFPVVAPGQSLSH